MTPPEIFDLSSHFVYGILIFKSFFPNISIIINRESGDKNQSFSHDLL